MRRRGFLGLLGIAPVAGPSAVGSVLGGAPLVGMAQSGDTATLRPVSDGYRKLWGAWERQNIRREGAFVTIPPHIDALRLPLVTKVRMAREEREREWGPIVALARASGVDPEQWPSALRLIIGDEA